MTGSRQVVYIVTSNVARTLVFRLLDEEVLTIPYFVCKWWYADGRKNATNYSSGASTGNITKTRYIDSPSLEESIVQDLAMLSSIQIGVAVVLRTYFGSNEGVFVKLYLFTTATRFEIDSSLYYLDGVLFLASLNSLDDYYLQAVTIGDEVQRTTGRLQLGI